MFGITASPYPESPLEKHKFSKKILRQIPSTIFTLQKIRQPNLKR